MPDVLSTCVYHCIQLSLAIYRTHIVLSELETDNYERCTENNENVFKSSLLSPLIIDYTTIYLNMNVTKNMRTINTLERPVYLIS